MLGCHCDEVISDRREIVLMEDGGRIAAHKAAEWRIATIVCIGVNAAAGRQISEAKDIRLLGGLSRAEIGLQNRERKCLPQKTTCFRVIEALPATSRVHLLPADH